MATPPWKKTPQNRTSETPRAKLTAESIAWAKARAQAAGRRYPNLVDNMAAAQRQRAASGAPGTNAPDHP